MSCCFFLGTLRDLLLRCWKVFCFFGIVQVGLPERSPLETFLCMAMLWVSSRMLWTMLWSCGMGFGDRAELPGLFGDPGVHCEGRAFGGVGRVRLNRKTPAHLAGWVFSIRQGFGRN